MAARNEITAHSRKNEIIHYKQNMSTMNDTPIKKQQPTKSVGFVDGICRGVIHDAQKNIEFEIK
jgi:hypothetical protein